MTPISEVAGGRFKARSVLLGALLIVVASPIAAREVRNDHPWRVVSITEPRPKLPDEKPTAIIHFAGGFNFKPHLYGVSVIGQLPSARAEPFLVVGGSGCTECDTDTHSIFIGQPTEWPTNLGSADSTGARGVWFSQYPHRNYHAETRTVLDWSRLFIGRCLTSGGETVVSFSATRDQTKNGWSHEIDWAEVESGHLSMHSVKRGGQSAPSLNVVQHAVGLKLCREVHGEKFDEPF